MNPSNNAGRPHSGGYRGGNKSGASRGGFARAGGAGRSVPMKIGTSFTARPGRSTSTYKNDGSRVGSSFGRPSFAPSRSDSFGHTSSRPSTFRHAPSRSTSVPGTSIGSARPASTFTGGSRSHTAGRSSSYAGRSSFGGSSRGGFGSGSRGGFSGRSRGGSRGGFGGGRGGRGGGFRGMGEHINPARFINKTVMTEEVEHFVPEHKFEDFKIDENLKKAIGVKGYRLPTPIQDRTIPHILQGADIVGIANTGTGKTAAFLIPAINKVLLNRREQVLIIVPTRELAIQIEEELKGFTPGMKMFSVCCVGGASISRQISQLRYQYNFVIGTPGRLKDLIERRMIRLAEFSTLVLDEADRMLDMGFVNDMRFVVAGMPKARQTMFFSATVSHEIEALVKEFLREPVRISVKTQDTSKNVEQDVVRIDRGSDKSSVLAGLLAQKEFSKVLVFGRTKHGVEKLATLLAQKGFKAESIHGNKNHAKRQHALRLFKAGNVQVLVATDVAARGLDIADVSHVINFDIPATYDDYVHRIGRTGRGNKKGKALTFLG